MEKYHMRRKEREITDRTWLEEVLNRGQMIHIGLAGEDGWPYVVPMGYGYADGVIYLHGAPVGKKNDMIAANPKACFQVSLDVEVLRAEAGSGFSMKYRSVTGYGLIRTLTTLDEKNRALKILMDHYDGPHTDLVNNDARLWVARLDIEHMMGKCGNYPRPDSV